MPLTAGHDQATISRNIREMIASGRPRDQAVAAALHNARRYATGGTPAPQTPTYTQGAPAQFTSAGLIPNIGGVGDYRLDPNTGALSPQTMANLQTLAQRGLPIAGTASAAPPPQAPAPNDILAQALNSWFGDSGQGGARGGRFAAGGVPTSSEMAPWFVRSEAHQMDHPTGLVASATPGRKDVVPLSVASGSYVMPADVVSGISEGNTLAGARHLEAAMHTGPGGMRLSHLVAHSTMPHPPGLAHLSRGGMADGQMPRMIHPHEWARRDVPNGIPVVVAGGEFIYGPNDVKHIGDGDLTRGHDRLDEVVLRVRARNVKTTANLPGPKKGHEK